MDTIYFSVVGERIRKFSNINNKYLRILIKFFG